MAIDKLKLYNSALRILGERSLANLTENREARRVLDGVWDEDPILYCLEQGQWQWASRTVKLSASNDVDPSEFGFQYAFELPEDYVRIVQMSYSETLEPPLNRFLEEGNFIFGDNDVLYLRYVSSSDQYGRDYSLWTPAFHRYVIAYIAHEASMRITSSAGLRRDVEEMVKRRLSDAQNKDGVNRPTMFMQRGTFSRARHGTSSLYNRDRRG